MRSSLRLFALFALAIPLALEAQTTVTNQAGSCDTAVSCSLALAGGNGSIAFAAVVGPNCLLGQSCGFGTSYAGSYFSYQWPDGSSAKASNFAGSMTFTGTGSCGAGCAVYQYTIAGNFSGEDSQARPFTGSTVQSITIDHHSKGGGTATDSGGTTTLSISGAPVSLPALSLSASPASASVVAGQSSTMTITATGQALTGPVSLSCVGLPMGVTCSFDPANFNMGTGSATSNLTISTTARTLAWWKRWNAALFGVMLASIVVVLTGSKHRRGRLLAVFLVLCILPSCGGVAGTSSGSTAASGISGGTPTGSFQIAVSGISGSAQSSAVITLVVQ
jgi:hypothetical protein